MTIKLSMLALSCIFMKLENSVCDWYRQYLLSVFILTMAGVSEVSETTRIKTCQTCSAREYEQGKRKKESERCRERKRERERGGGERERDRINRDVYIVCPNIRILI